MKKEKRISKILCRSFILLVFATGLLTPVLSDIVTLENGSEIFGEVTLDGEKTLKIKTPAGNLEFPRDKVVKVTRESKSVTYGKFGKYYLDRKEYDKAIDAYEIALKDDPENAGLKSQLEQVNQLAKTVSSSQADEILSAGDRAVTQEQYDNAIDSYSKITTMNLGEGWNKKAFEKIAHVYILQANLTQEASKREDFVGKALALDPQSAEALYEQGMIYLQKNQNELARQQFEQTLAFDPTYAKAHRILGNLYYGEQKFLEATQHYEQLKKMSPDLFSSVKQNLISAYQTLGTQAYQNQKYDEAQLWLEKYLDLEPSGNWSLLYQTQYHLKLMAIDPTKSDDHFNLGLWCQDKNLDSDALTEYKTAYKLDNSSFKAKRKMIELYDKFASGLYQTGTMNLNSQQFNQAISSFTRITANYPESSFYADASRLIGVSREQWSESLYNTAKANFDANNFDKAFEGFNAIVQDFPESSRFVDAQRLLARTKSKIRFETIPVNDRKQKLDELQKLIDSSSGEDRQAWDKILEMETMSQYDFEARLANLNYRERLLLHDNLERDVYLFYDPDKDVKESKLYSISLKYQLPLFDKSKVRNVQDVAKVYQFALLLASSLGGDYYNGWQQLIPYFSTSRSELEDAKAKGEFSDEAVRLIEEHGSEVTRMLNLQSNR
jgi:tetratricopeptide (TPR) repeat protein